MPWYEASRNLARLLRIRRENEAGRMVAGLGARNVPWARAHAGPLGADVSGYKGVVSAADQAAFARQQGEQFSQRYGSYETADVRLARMEAQMERFRNLARQSGTDAPMRPGAATGAETLRQRLAQKGFGVKAQGFKLGPIQLTRRGLQLDAGFIRGANKFGGKFLAISALSNAVAGAAGSAAAGLETYQKFKDPAEAAKTGVLALQRAGFETLDSLVPMRDIASGLASVLTGGKTSRAEARKSIDKVVEDLFTTGEEKARRAKARNDQLSAMYEEVHKSVGDMWAKVHATLPQSFSIKARDRFAFRAELGRANEQAIFAIHEAQKNQAERAIEAGDASGN